VKVAITQRTDTNRITDMNCGINQREKKRGVTEEKMEGPTSP
jgi:hypothetical protein